MLSKTDVCASPKYYTCTIIFMAVCMLKVPIPRRYLVCYQKMLRRMFIHECETVSNNVNETTLINMDQWKQKARMPYYLIQYYAAQLGECQKFWYRIFGLKYPTTTLPTKCSQTQAKGCTVKIRLSFLKIFIIDIFVSECPLDHLIFNHFSRKVQKSGLRNLVRKIWFEKSGWRKMVLQTWIFWLSG